MARKARTIFKLTRTTSAGTLYYHEDGLGNVVKLTDGTGTVQEGYSYDIFGAVTIRDGSGTVLTASASGNRFLYTGREYIAELGLYDYRNRVYSPNLGRFLQTDPIRFNAGDINIYRYCGNNPMNGFDPLGQSFLGSVENFFTGAASGAIGGLVTGAAVGFVASGFNPLGALAGAGAGAIAGGLAGGIAATANGVVNNNGDYSLAGSVGSGALSGVLAGLPGGAAASELSTGTIALAGAAAGAGGNLLTTDPTTGMPGLNPDATPLSVAASATGGAALAGLGGIGDGDLDPITAGVFGLDSALIGELANDVLNALGGGSCPNK